LFVEPDIK